MELITLKYKRLSPSESVSKLKSKGKRTNKIIYRHRYTLLNKNTRKQEFKDYKESKFASFDKFVEFIEEKPKYKGQLIV